LGWTSHRVILELSRSPKSKRPKLRQQISLTPATQPYYHATALNDFLGTEVRHEEILAVCAGACAGDCSVLRRAVAGAGPGPGPGGLRTLDRCGYQSAW